MASTSSSAAFYTTFQSLKAEINKALDDSDLSKASQSLVDLKTQFRENVVYLPAYDERSYDTQIRELESRLSSLRPKSSKFSFAKSKSKSDSPKTIPPSNPSPNDPKSSAQKLTARTNDDRSTGSDAVRLENKTGQRLDFSDLSLPTSDSSSISSSTLTNTSTVILKDLEGCIIDLRPSPTSSSAVRGIEALHANNLNRCILLVPVEGSILLHSITDCILVVSSHQFRMHDSSNTTVLISIPSMPIIEHSTSIAFGPLPPALLRSTLDNEMKSRHWEVQDFDWVREGDSPNWNRVGTSGESAYDELVELLRNTLLKTRGSKEDVGELVDETIACSSRLRLRGP